jgi:transcriptional regulator with XRE-family HTH domain
MRISSLFSKCDVADYCGVSLATISSYITGNAPISREVAKSDLQITPGLQYGPDATPRSLCPFMNGEPAEQVSLLRIHPTPRRSCGCSDLEVKRANKNTP